MGPRGYALRTYTNCSAVNLSKTALIQLVSIYCPELKIKTNHYSNIRTGKILSFFIVLERQPWYWLIQKYLTKIDFFQFFLPNQFNPSSIWAGVS